MDAALRERTQEDGERGDKSLALACGHLGDFALMEDDAAYELDVVVDHIPCYFVAAGHPVVFPESLVTLDADEVAALACELAVEVGGGDLDNLVMGETGSSLAEGCEDDGQVLVKLVFYDVENIFLMFVDFVPDGLALVVGKRLDRSLEGLDLLMVFGSGGGDVGADGVDAAAELVVAQSLHFGAQCLDFINNRLNRFQIALRFVTKNFG